MKRRRFLQAASASAFAFHVVPRHVLGRGQTPPSKKLAIAGIGIGGQKRNGDAASFAGDRNGNATTIDGDNGSLVS